MGVAVHAAGAAALVYLRHPRGAAAGLRRGAAVVTSTVTTGDHSGNTGTGGGASGVKLPAAYTTLPSTSVSTDSMPLISSSGTLKKSFDNSTRSASWPTLISPLALCSLENRHCLWSIASARFHGRCVRCHRTAASRRRYGLKPASTVRSTGYSWQRGWHRYRGRPARRPPACAPPAASLRGLFTVAIDKVFSRKAMRCCTAAAAERFYPLNIGFSDGFRMVKEPVQTIERNVAIHLLKHIQHAAD